ncbi:contractile injection system tape measure protein [Mucilaginibacter phyllosphaerae]|uniref:Uncharacterized protein n=1 Tax=Mucilaginibacter phyllosphaerae TaxID=1812349 RepID=A0A4Y8ADE7_9SPHI|nr:contractile injection system tape measure protein [Mucilaginibacter phyllosphaerae]MBB3969158.1 hypothetical protein [Mucilaginibacter phyllosphaerae]TEW66032.1 hypothetical protein E2R65_12980 [Mucilaginibacter phyllosphaerae]GGH06664.1 hypothetical protein GCM10007352_11010 [Mucilaginibacter phyllosphaerae]
MPSNPHVIKRQLIDLRIDKRLDTAQIQDKVSRLFETDILPIIDRYLNTLGNPDDTYRIDHLEIDLGVIHAASIGEEIKKRLTSQLELKQLKAIPFTGQAQSYGHSGGSTAAHQTEADLIAHFLRTGTFPWWAKEVNSTVLKNALDSLLTKEAAAISSLLGPLLASPASLKRLIFVCDDTTLYQITGKIKPAHNFNAEWQAYLYKAFTPVLSLNPYRQLWWASALQQTVTAALPGSIAPAILILFFDTLAKAEFATLNKLPGKGSAAKVLAFYDDKVRALNVLLSTVFGGPIHTGGTLQDQITQLSKTAERLFNSHTKPQHHTDTGAAVATIQSLFDVVRMHFGFKPGLQQDKAVSGGLKKMAGPDDIYVKQVPSLASPVDEFSDVIAEATDVFSDSDKLYINYAGLVLLAPFISRFFKSINLADGKSFTDEEAAEKACLLLQYLAAGKDWERFEPHLTLNKLLCGMELYRPVNVQLEISPSELEAADHLLAAVIANAPLWKTLSTDGLRRTYLQREGILSSRDGNWLLQVKRETYDILIDRLPWSARVVKLPWMKNLIFVEWQLD